MPFRTKQEILLSQIDRCQTNGVRLAAWTFDEFYGRDGKFLDGLEERQQVYVVEVPTTFRVWLRKPKVLRRGPKRRGRGRQKTYPRLAERPRSCEVRNLLKFSPTFRNQRWQRYHVKDSDKGPVVWEVKWTRCWRKRADGLPSRQQTLLVARHVLTGEVKYFLSNRVPGRDGMTVRWLLQVGFARWSVESCFRQAKEELGLDHYEVRGWRCVHRHFFVTQLSQLFCARIRQEHDPGGGGLTVEQVRSAMNTWLDGRDLQRGQLERRLEEELARQQYYQRRNQQARTSHTKTRRQQLAEKGIDVDRIKSCRTGTSKDITPPVATVTDQP